MLMISYFFSLARFASFNCLSNIMECVSIPNVVTSQHIFQSNFQWTKDPNKKNRITLKRLTFLNVFIRQFMKICTIPIFLIQQWLEIKHFMWLWMVLDHFFQIRLYFPFTEWCSEKVANKKQKFKKKKHHRNIILSRQIKWASCARHYTRAYKRKPYWAD